MRSIRSNQHLVVDSEVIDGLRYAYRAREALQLPDGDRARGIRDAIHRTARGTFWRYPTIRLNQVNWYALMYAADATVTGDTHAARSATCPCSCERFFAGVARRAASRAGNFGPGMRFHYLPQHGRSTRDERRLRRVREHRR